MYSLSTSDVHDQIGMLLSKHSVGSTFTRSEAAAAMSEPLCLQRRRLGTWLSVGHPHFRNAQGPVMTEGMFVRQRKYFA